MLNEFELAAKSIRKIKGTKLEFVSKFHEKLFELHPELQPFFNLNDPIKQKKILSGFLILVSERWQQTEFIASVFKRLGASYFQAGIQPAYFPLFGKVFLLTLAEYLGENWNKEIKQAWFKTFDLIIELMWQGYEEAKASTALLQVKSQKGKTQISSKGSTQSHQDTQKSKLIVL